MVGIRPSSPPYARERLSTFAATRGSSAGRCVHALCSCNTPNLPTTAPAPAPAPKTVQVPAQFPKALYLHTQVLKPAQSSPLRSALETIASDGPITAALTSTAEASVSQIPELFRSVMPSQSAAVAERAGAAVETVKKGEQEIKQLASLPGQWTSQFRGEIARRSPAAAGHVVARLQEWWHRERVFRVVEAALPNRKMDGLAVDGE